VTITDTDAVVQFASNHAHRLEDATEVRLAVIRGESPSPATVDVVTTDVGARAGVDYVGGTNTLAVSRRANAAEAGRGVVAAGRVREAAEAFRVLLRNPTGGAQLGANRSATVTILDNDPGLGFATNSHSIRGKAQRLEVQVRRGSDEWLGPFTVDYATSNSTARAGVDYEAASGTLVFRPDERVKAVPSSCSAIPPAALPSGFTCAYATRRGRG